MRWRSECVALLLLLAVVRVQAEDALPAQTEYEPSGGKGHVVVVVSGQTGPGNYAYVAKQLADAGYYTVLVDGNDFWIKGGGGEQRLEGVIGKARQSPHALPGKAAVIGFSLGGASTLTYAARMPDAVSAVVAYYPLTAFIKDPAEFIAKTKVPALVFAGERDRYKNCCLITTARALAEAAKASKGKVALELVEYSDAGHGFNIMNSKEWRPSDAEDAMRHTLDFLKKHPGE